jgi:PS-10 peptidase S37
VKRRNPPALGMSLALAIFPILLSMLGACSAGPVEVGQPLTRSEPPPDIAEQLAAVPGLTVEERTPPAEGYRHFVLAYQQPVDHGDPSGASFRQSIMLVHHDSDAPVVIDTEGYVSSPEFPSYGLLAWMLDGNKIAVEHRFFGQSIPQSPDFRHLDIDQAAADHHRIIQALRPLYPGAWISTGASKGGMTASYHRRRYPDDVEGTVADVAPMSFGHEDRRYVHFLDQVGAAECRSKARDFQRLVLSRRASLVPLVEALVASYQDGLSALPGGADQALDIAAGEFLFAFWQYAGSSACPYIPGADASDEALIRFLDAFGLFAVASDQALAFFGPYYYQAVTQLGFPRLPTEHLKDLLHHDPNDYRPYVAAFGELPPFDHHAMIDMAIWSAFFSERLLFVYGTEDPWTAGAYPVLHGSDRDVLRFYVPGGTHGSTIADLTGEERSSALDALARWTRVTPRWPEPQGIRTTAPPPDAWVWTEPPRHPRLRPPL